MTIFVLDASALLRYVDREAGESRMRAIFKACATGQGETHLSAVQWGEVAGNLQKRFGAQRQRRILESLMLLDLKIVSASAERAVRAAQIKVDHKLGYADAFAVELAMDSADHVLVTADYGFKAVADKVRIEFLPVK